MKLGSVHKKEDFESVDIGDGDFISLCRKYQNKFWLGEYEELRTARKIKVNNSCTWL